MEQEYVAGRYQSLGTSGGEEFSSEDVCLLYRKVFHVSSSSTEALAAIKKITQSDNSRSCSGENILHVLLEMEREREKKELLYWDLQLLNAGNFNGMMDWMQQSTDPGTTETASPQMMKRKLCGRATNVRKLKRAARQRWARLVTEGLQSLLPSACEAQGAALRCRAWGFISLSDLLLLVDVKYDAVTRLLYTEMLQMHHTESIWKMLPPWQQRREEEGLEDLADEALESADVLTMAELPGAFRIYSDKHTRTTISFNAIGESCPGSKTECWTAISFLNDLYRHHQHERHTLTVLSQRLNEESLRLLCLHIRLATLRAQREKKSHNALLAARQSWEAWPHVYSPCRDEQVSVWLFGHEEEKEEEAEEDTETLHQQALLQLVLVHEHERKHLVRLIHEVSLEDLKGSCCSPPSKDPSHMQASLRKGCIQRLRQIHTCLKTDNQSENRSEQTSLRLKLQIQRENCGMLLLTRLLQLQEGQASALLQALADNKAQHPQALLDEYRSGIQAKCFPNLLHLLTSDDPLTSGSAGHPYRFETSGQSGAPRDDEAQNVSAAFTGAQTDISSEGTRGGVTAEPDKQDLCSGCGAFVEDLPYLEISCAKSDIQEAPPAEGRAQTEDKYGATKTQQSCEKRGSLITLAWSKLPEDGSGREEETATGENRQNPKIGNSEKTQIQPTDMKNDSTPLQRTSTGQHDAQPADRQVSSVEQVIVNAASMGHQVKEGRVTSECDLQTHIPGSESLQAIQAPPHLDPPEANPRVDDLCPETANDIAGAAKEVPTVERSATVDESELWELPEAEPHHHGGQECHPEAAVDCRLAEIKAEELTLTKREWVGEPVSAMERERTMRNLVDMQRKYERKQQRDRERQQLRVQERLSIVQNRKAEDLLGLKHTDRLKHLTQDLLLEDRNQQKTIVKERLEQLRRERSCIIQSKRARNTAGFKELLGPVVLHTTETEDGADWDTTTV